MNEWIIQSRAHACQACGKSFADKDTYHTILTSHKQELLRQDICPGCWAVQNAKLQGSVQGAAGHKGFISQWQAIYHAPPPSSTADPIQKETAETLLRKLILANDPQHGPACYILAVMLERKRQLKIKQQIRRDGVRIFIYEHPKTGDLFTITDPDLQLNQLDAVQRDVTQLLVHGLPENLTAHPQQPNAAQTPTALQTLELAPVQLTLDATPLSQPAPKTEDAPQPAPIHE